LLNRKAEKVLNFIFKTNNCLITLALPQSGGGFCPTFQSALKPVLAYVAGRSVVARSALYGSGALHPRAAHPPLAEMCVAPWAKITTHRRRAEGVGVGVVIGWNARTRRRGGTQLWGCAVARSAAALAPVERARVCVGLSRCRSAHCLSV